MASTAVSFGQQQTATIVLNKIQDKRTLIPSWTSQQENVQHGVENGSKALVYEALKERIKDIDTFTCDAGEEDAFYVADLGQVYRQHLRWKKNLPRVKPHYAIKCNPDPAVLSLLANMGTGFDCASKGEIDQMLELGVEPSRIIYAQPCKTRSFIKHASNKGVSQMTFDNTDELHKIAAVYPTAELYLRIATDDSSSMCRLSTKFGAPMDDVPKLLRVAHQLELNIVGVSFHVGSGAADPEAIVGAVRDARTVFDAGEKLGFRMHTLDVGGGFTSELFELFATALTGALDTYFPSPDIRIIAEPGRYYVSGAYTLASTVIARREVVDPETGIKSYMLYLNDGIYGNFSSIIYDHQIPVPKILSAGDSESRRCWPTEYSIWGPTCDSIDRITPGTVTFDSDIRIGDWMYFEDMGAYTRCVTTKFNGFKDNYEVIYVYSEAGAKALMYA